MIETLKSSYQKAVDFLAKWWFLASTLAIAVMAYIIKSKETQLGDLHDQIQMLTLQQKLQKINEEAQADESKYDESRNDYVALKRRHPELFQRLGIDPNSPTQPPSGPNAA